MARLSDVPRVFAAVGVLTFAKRVWAQISEDNLLTWASALAYSWLFAVFPFMIFIISLFPYLPPAAIDRAKAELAELVYELPKESADTLWEYLEPRLAKLEQPKGWLTFVGLGLALWAASGGMATTMQALDKCYELEVGRPFYKQRPIAVLVTVIVAVLIVSVLVLLPIGTFVKAWVTHPQRGYVDPRSPLLVVFDVVRWALALTFLVAALTLIYHVGPSVKHRFHWVTPGAVFCVVVWILLGLGFRVYIDRFGKYEQTYGTVGGVAVLLLLFYIDSLVLLIGAEINSEIDFEVLKVKRGTRDFRPAEDVTEQLPLTEPVPPEVAEEASKASEAADQAADEAEAERIEREEEEEARKSATP